MTKLLTPDYFTQNTCLFKDNFLHEIPVDVQQAIMGEVDKLNEEELKRKEKLEKLLADYTHLIGSDPEDITSRAVSNILWELKVRINDDDDDDKYQDLLHTLIDEQCQFEDWLDDKIGDMESVVDWAGVMHLLKKLTKEYGLNILDHTTDELYAKCYYMHLYYVLEDFDCNDIKIIQKYNINVLIND
tara:strand:+ start:51 stop:611 length:561 start_codon:yes stop_codon:yes gene_type:complete